MRGDIIEGNTIVERFGRQRTTQVDLADTVVFGHPGVVVIHVLAQTVGDVVSRKDLVAESVVRCES